MIRVRVFPELREDHARAQPPQGADQLMAMPLADRPGWQRVGLSTKVPELLPLMRAMRSSGGSVEHVYDY